MLKELRNAYKKSSIAIIGSGPSAKDFSENEDLAIVVNGAAVISKKYDIFIAGDKQAPSRDWWLSTENQENHANILRLVSSYIAPFDPILYPDDEIRTKLQEKYSVHILNSKEKYGYTSFVPDVKPKQHKFFKFGGLGLEHISKINPNQELMYWGGTISAIALQLGLILGAKEINLYGCGFNNDSGTNYVYSCTPEQKGKTSTVQRVIMQETINHIYVNFNVDINVVGNSRLESKTKNKVSYYLKASGE